MEEKAFNEGGTPKLDPDTGEHMNRWRYIKHKGSSRSSKTISLIDAMDLTGRRKRNKRLTVWRDTKTDCKKTVLNDVLKRLKGTRRWMRKMDFNKTESIITYSTGSTFEIHGTDDEETVHGLTQDIAWLNEPYKISKETFDQIDQRTKDFVFLDMNPKKGHWSDDIEKDPRCLVIHSTFRDNPFCSAGERNKILSYQPLSMTDAVEIIRNDPELWNYVDIRIRQKLGEKEKQPSVKAVTEWLRSYDVVKNVLNFGEYEIEEIVRCMENGYKNSASEFNWSVYGLGVKAERPNRIYTHFEEIPDEEYFKIPGTIYTASDWGSVDPWAIIDAKYWDGTLYVRERNYLSEREIRQKLTPTEFAEINAAEEGIVKWMFKKLNIPFDRHIGCDTNRPLKITALRNAGWDYAVAVDKPKGSKKDGIDLVNNIRVCYTKSSTNVKYESENYSYKVHEGIVQEEPEDFEDHTMDDIRYIALLLQQLGIITNV